MLANRSKFALIEHPQPGQPQEAEAFMQPTKSIPNHHWKGIWFRIQPPTPLLFAALLGVLL
jgi:hypothetical protein